MNFPPKHVEGDRASLGAFEDPSAIGCDRGLIGDLREVVGRRHVLTRAASMRRFTTGYRHGSGEAACVARPGDLVQFWRCLKICVKADVVVVIQSANTGLTGGSTPDGFYGRPVIIINTMRMKGIHVIEGGRQVVCLPGSTLNELEAVLEPLNREPHSVIGSSCIGASVVGGICNNSGGALVQRGPAYTELALFAQQDAHGALHLVNHLGIRLGEDPETILQRVQDGRFLDDDVESEPAGRASSSDYVDRVRRVDEDTPARFNADPTFLFEASGSAGKIALFAVRLDTFEKDRETATFYIGTNDVDDLARLRRELLVHLRTLPISCEYIHRDAFDIAEQYGKDTFVAIERLGTRRLPALFAAKAWIDRLALRMPLRLRHVSDHLLQAIAWLLPQHLPQRMVKFRDQFEHHLILKMGGAGIEEARLLLATRYPNRHGAMFECTKIEEAKAFLQRFAVAGAAVRYRAVHAQEVGEIVALDVALRRNDSDWFVRLPPEVARHVDKSLYYGHFLCNVFHLDYILKKGSDEKSIKGSILNILDGKKAEYPAEHNVGHLYKAKSALVQHYKYLDPSNNFNPGIGQTNRNKNWI